MGPDHDEADDLRRWTRWLSSPRLEGRGIGCRGGDLAARWIGRQMDRFGLGVGPGLTERFQIVPMTRSCLQHHDSRIDLLAANSPLRLDGRSDFCFRSRAGGTAGLTHPLVFVGYGVVAPEHGWNDYAHVAMRGSIAVILSGEPPFRGETGAAAGPMSQYGRWTYKLEEAARQGAFGALLIHDETALGYSFAVVRASFSAPYTALRAAEPGLALEAWCSAALGRTLLSCGGIAPDRIAKAAAGRGFRARRLRSRLRADIRCARQEFDCRNVIGIVPGSAAAGEIVVLVAHWDHLGRIVLEDGTVRIFPGAADNATGISLLLALARRHARAPPPRRTLLFLASTGEESGSLGAHHFVRTLAVPPDRVVAAFNIDGILPIGRTRDLQIIGTDYCDIGESLAKIFEASGRRVTPDDAPQLGYYFRADQISFAQAGIPAVQVATGWELVDGGIAEGARRHRQYDAERYHTERDRFDQGWDFAGVAADAALLFEATRSLALGDHWPSWHPGISFGRARAGRRR